MVGTSLTLLCPPDSSLQPSVLLTLHPVLKHLQRRRAIVVGRLGESAVVALADPALFRRRIVAGQRQPHQATRGLPWQAVAVEQHLAEHGLRLMLALLGRQTKPARAVAEIVPRSVRRLQVKPSQI